MQCTRRIALASASDKPRLTHMPRGSQFIPACLSDFWSPDFWSPVAWPYLVPRRPGPSLTLFLKKVQPQPQPQMSIPDRRLPFKWYARDLYGQSSTPSATEQSTDTINWHNGEKRRRERIKINRIESIHPHTIWKSLKFEFLICSSVQPDTR